MSANYKAYLFVHIIWSVYNRKALLGKPIRHVLFAHMQKNAEENGIKILAVNGVEDHMHCLVQLHPTQNLSVVIKAIKNESFHWLNENKLLQENFEWEEGYAAYSVSPTAVKQVMDYIHKQQEHHKTKTLDSELEMFEKIHVPG